MDSIYRAVIVEGRALTDIELSDVIKWWFTCKIKEPSDQGIIAQIGGLMRREEFRLAYHMIVKNWKDLESRKMEILAFYCEARMNYYYPIFDIRLAHVESDFEKTYLDLFNKHQSFFIGDSTDLSDVLKVFQSETNDHTGFRTIFLENADMDECDILVAPLIGRSELTYTELFLSGWWMMTEMVNLRRFPLKDFLSCMAKCPHLYPLVTNVIASHSYSTGKLADFSVLRPSSSCKYNYLLYKYGPSPIISRLEWVKLWMMTRRNIVAVENMSSFYRTGKLLEQGITKNDLLMAKGE